MRALDTNVLVRLIVRDHPKQAAAAEAFVEKGAWVSAARARRDDMGARLHLRATGDGDRERDRHAARARADSRCRTLEVVAGALTQFRKRPSVSFSDCLLVEIARKAGHLPLGHVRSPSGQLPGAERL